MKIENTLQRFSSISFLFKPSWFMYFFCIYKKPIILSLFKIDPLNFIMYVLTLFTCPLTTYVIRLGNLLSINIFFTMKDHSFSLYGISSNKRPQRLFNFETVRCVAY